jgi:hypothetical protein
MSNKKYKVIITCPDCTGVDFQGCGDGYPWELDETFDTIEEANDAGDEATGDTWEYEVVPEEI